MCSLFGLIDYKHTLSGNQKSRILSVLATECEVRGTDATGIAYNSRGRLQIFKKAVPAHEMKIRIPSDSHVIMGHTRMTTQGSEKIHGNNHPFPGNVSGKRFALAHNGVLYNDTYLRTKLHLPKTPIETDSYVAVQLLEQSNALNLNSLKTMAEQVEGTFVFTVLDDENTIYIAKGDNPICIYRYPSLGLILYASTVDILEAALTLLDFHPETLERVMLQPGELCRIDAHGRVTRKSFHFHHPLFSLAQPVISYAKRGYGTYIRQLRRMAGWYGYDTHAVDELLDEGFTPEEVEECLCYGWR